MVSTAAAGGFVLVLLSVPDPPKLLSVSVSPLSDSGGQPVTLDLAVMLTSITTPDPPKLPSVSVSPSGQIVEGSSVNLTCAVMLTQQLTTPDPPKLPSVSVSPSGQIVEGSSVNLTCSSDANPAANYTWYKENQRLLQGPGGSYNFTSISSEDRGIYYCRSKNQYGQSNSSLFIDVQYPPKLPSVSVSPSGQIVEGSPVNLTCGTTIPAANYTWYKENEDSPKFQDRFTITDFRAEHSGNTYQKPRMKEDVTPTLYLTVKTFSSKQPLEQKNSLHYASVHFSMKQADPLYLNIKPAQPLGHQKEGEAAGVEYATVIFNRDTADPRPPGEKIIRADAPVLPSVSVSPSGQIVEGSSVTLTCSSDANPAANYTWYKENDAPKLPSVSVSPSGQIVEGSSVV
ncbi:hemicentin-1-like isoform X5 [Lates japonicus]|uniref:Hemicentin-1-like isoform X5 n=1 Tax=Lates japonicus TaxID=270547 RepID=A0AAD3RB28_LATJO|nr:hemicentin-1-like isoform X5 [Lates japonicus]